MQGCHWSCVCAPGDQPSGWSPTPAGSRSSSPPLGRRLPAGGGQPGWRGLRQPTAPASGAVWHASSRSRLLPDPRERRGDRRDRLSQAHPTEDVGLEGGLQAVWRGGARGRGWRPRRSVCCCAGHSRRDEDDCRVVVRTEDQRGVPQGPRVMTSCGQCSLVGPRPGLPAPQRSTSSGADTPAIALVRPLDLLLAAPMTVRDALADAGSRP